MPCCRQPSTDRGVLILFITADLFGFNRLIDIAKKTCNFRVSALTAKAYVTQNVGIRGGEPVQFARSLQHCWKVCLSLASCRGFDFHGSRKASLNNTQCFLHGKQSICNRHVHLPGSDNYRLHVCGASCVACQNIVSSLLY